MGICNPRLVRAIVNDGRYDLFNPDEQHHHRHDPAYARRQRRNRGRPRAQREPGRVAAAMFELMKSDDDGTQGAGDWKTAVALTFDWITEPHG